MKKQPFNEAVLKLLRLAEMSKQDIKMQLAFGGVARNFTEQYKDELLGVSGNGCSEECPGWFKLFLNKLSASIGELSGSGKTWSIDYDDWWKHFNAHPPTTKPDDERAQANETILRLNNAISEQSDELFKLRQGMSVSLGCISVDKDGTKHLDIEKFLNTAEGRSKFSALTKGLGTKPDNGCYISRADAEKIRASIINHWADGVPRKGSVEGIALSIIDTALGEK